MPEDPIQRPWPSQGSILEILAEERPKAHLFVVDVAQSRTIACIEDGRCEIYYEGEASPQQKMTVLTQAKQAGITAFENGALIDFTHFIGIIDWDYARSQANPLPGFPPPPKVAYVMRDEMAAMYAKGILSFIKISEWQVFTTRKAAEAWLGWR